MTREDMKKQEFLLFFCQRCKKVREIDKWKQITEREEKILQERKYRILTTLCPRCSSYQAV